MQQEHENAGLAGVLVPGFAAVLFGLLALGGSLAASAWWLGLPWDVASLVGGLVPLTVAALAVASAIWAVSSDPLSSRRKAWRTVLWIACGVLLLETVLPPLVKLFALPALALAVAGLWPAHVAGPLWLVPAAAGTLLATRLVSLAVAFDLRSVDAFFAPTLVGAVAAAVLSVVFILQARSLHQAPQAFPTPVAQA